MFLHGNVVDQWFPLNKGSKRAGEINLRIQLCGSGASGKASKIPSAQPYPIAQPAYPPQVLAAAAPAYPQAYPSKLDKFMV
jgi:hypothetical protein